MEANPVADRRVSSAERFAMKPSAYALAIHGGAGPTPGRDYSEVEAHLGFLIREGEKMLASGATAVDVVETLVRELEISGLYVAGRGSVPNADGYVEMDAAIMDGSTALAGAVAALRDIESPITAARAVMDNTRHVMLAGSGATHFCEQQNLPFVSDPQSWYRLPVGVELSDLESSDSGHGTVGAVALDQNGKLAAATSTGGLFGKLPGRVGDSPLIGSGTWADEQVAVSCTGVGECFIRANVAHSIAMQVRLGVSTLEQAAENALAEVQYLGGDGGLIALDNHGNISMPWNSSGLKRAWVRAGKAPGVKIFGTPVKSR